MLDFELPTEIIKANSDDPTNLIIVSHAKTGKTSACAQLPNSFLVDLENGSEFIDGKKINLKKEISGKDVNIFQAIKYLTDKLKEANAKAGGYFYDYGIIDTTSELESLAVKLATTLYKRSAAGKNFKGDNVVTELEHGGGYGWLRTAFEILYDQFVDLFPHIIFLAHTKKASINKDGKSLGARDIDLTGKLKNIICAKADAIGFMYRNPKAPKQNMLSFKNNLYDLVSGARPKHLREKEIIISELIGEEGKEQLVTYWDEVYLNLKNKK